MAPNNAYFVSIPQVGVDHLRRAGMDLDVQTTDFTNMLPRRSSPGSPDKGGWNMFGVVTAELHYCPIRHVDWQPPLFALCCEGSATFIDFPDRL